MVVWVIEEWEDEETVNLLGVYSSYDSALAAVRLNEARAQHSTYIETITHHSQTETGVKFRPGKDYVISKEIVRGAREDQTRPRGPRRG